MPINNLSIQYDSREIRYFVCRQCIERKFKFNLKEKTMKKIVSALFVLATLMSNVVVASECHPDEHKDDHGHCVKK